ncbi:small ribosomal subunit protein uS11m [Pelodytes ibericus]
MNPILRRVWTCFLPLGITDTAGALKLSWCRALFTGVLRPQQSITDTGNQSSKDFSLVPPMPGQSTVLRWGGKKFEELPIVHIKATYNNTHIQVTSFENRSLVRTSCGTEGFRNSKKNSTVAAQTAGISAGTKAVTKGLSHVRVIVKGLGPGRLSAIKGLSMGGLEVISVTDNTPIPHNGCRPRKARRI